MNIYDNNSYTMQVYCDGYMCNDFLELVGEYIECIEELKENEWKITKEEDEWQHYCPKCAARERSRDVFDDLTGGEL